MRRRIDTPITARQTYGRWKGLIMQADDRQSSMSSGGRGAGRSGRGMRRAVRRSPHRASGLVTVLVTLAAAVALGGGLLSRPPSAQALDNGVARTPPMGWNTWNTFGCNISESLVRG